MAADKTCNWIGKSGRSYLYHVHGLPTDFASGQDGNYIFTKVVNGKWVPIYIGEGDLAERTGSSHHQAQCINQKGATHTHVHLNSSREARKSEESDLLANYLNSYSPNGCNEKIAG